MTRPGYKLISAETLEHLSFLTGRTIEINGDAAYLETDSGYYWATLSSAA